MPAALGFVAAVFFAWDLVFFFMVFVVLIVLASRPHSIHSKVERLSTELTHQVPIHYTSVLLEDWADQILTKPL